MSSRMSESECRDLPSVPHRPASAPHRGSLMTENTSNDTSISRRAMLGMIGKAAAASVVLPPILQAAILPDYATSDSSLRGVRAGAAPVNGIAGVDRVVVLPGKTYLRAWAGYGEPP